MNSRTLIPSSKTRIILAIAAALALIGVAIGIYQQAHKVISLDVDGKITRVTTFSGSVAGVLAEQNIEVSENDLVSPAQGDKLHGDDDIVVRYARVIDLEQDGQVEQITTTALDTTEVLNTFASRGETVKIMASRSENRTEIGLRLRHSGTINVVADGQTRVVKEASSDAWQILNALEITLNPLDTVHVERDASGTTTLVVQRVTVDQEQEVIPVAFQSEVQQDASRYSDLAKVKTVSGQDGEIVRTYEVTRIDGQEQKRDLLSEETTKEAVTEVYVVGTKERPKVVAQAPSQSKAASTTTPPDQTTPAPSTSGSDVWAALAKCESGGNPSVVSKNGKYHGLYQFSVATWQSVGGTGLPSQATAEEQTLRAQILQQRSGWGQWPHCSSKLGLR